MTKIFITFLVLFLLIYTICWNVDTLGGARKIISPRMQWIGYLTGLDQEWNMFAPEPLTDDGWYVFPGTLRDGSSVDVFNGSSMVSYNQPEIIAKGYKNQRWQKYLMNLWLGDNSDYRLAYGQYLCRQWNDAHPYPQQLITFEMIFMLKTTPPPGISPGPIMPNIMWTHYCY